MSGKNNTSTTASVSKCSVELRPRMENINYSESESPPVSPRQPSSQGGDGGNGGLRTSPDTVDLPEWAKMLDGKITQQLEETNKTNKTIQDALKSISDIVQKIQDLETNLNNKIDALEKELKSEHKNLTEEYENRINNMEIQFNDRLDQCSSNYGSRPITGSHGHANWVAR